VKLSTRLKRSSLLNNPTFICLTEWKKISLLLSLCHLIMRNLWKINLKSLILSNKSKERSKKRGCNLRLSLKVSWRISRRNKGKDKKEFTNFKNVSEIRKNLYKRESRDKEETKRSLKLPPTRTRIWPSWRWEILYKFKNFGTPSWERRWRKKWETPMLLMMLSKLLRPPLVSQMSKRWSRNSYKESRLTPCCW